MVVVCEDNDGLGGCGSANTPPSTFAKFGISDDTDNNRRILAVLVLAYLNCQ